MLRQQVSQLLSQGLFAQAEALCDKAIAGGEEPEAIHFKAVSRTQAGRYSEAFPIYEEARKRMPKNPDVLYNFGSAYQQSGDLERALEMWRLTIILNPGDTRALYNIAAALNYLGRAAEAEAAYRTVLSLDPSHGFALLDLGSLLYQKGDIATAAKALTRAVQIMPHEKEAWLNLAATFKESRAPAEAVTCLRHVLDIDPHYAPAHSALAKVLLQQGLWQEGFAELEWQSRAEPAPLSGLPAWDGKESLQGRRVLVWCDSDLSNSLLFARYLTPLQAQGSASVTLLCPPSLCGLFSQLPAVSAVWPLGAPLGGGDFDLGMPLTGLPHLLARVDPANIGTKAYLPAPAKGPGVEDGGRLRVGLIWSGDSSRSEANRGDVSLDTLLPLLELESCVFYSQQLAPTARDQERLANDPRISVRAPRSSNYGDVAAAMGEVDLLVTADGAIAHLAGALGAPLCVLLPWVADWRWGLEGADAP